MLISDLLIDSLRKYQNNVLMSYRAKVLSGDNPILEKLVAEIDVLSTQIEAGCNRLLVISNQLKESPSSKRKPNPATSGQEVFKSSILKSRLIHEVRDGWRSINTSERPYEVRNSGLGIGDVLMCLPVIAQLGTSNFHLTCQTTNYPYSHTHPYHNKEYRDRTYSKLAEFIKFQGYIEDCTYEDFDFEKEYDLDFDYSRYYSPQVRMPANDRMFWLFLLQREHPNSKWLRTQSGSSSDFSGVVMVQHAKRYPTLIDWNILKTLDEDIRFVGLEDEYEMFCSKLEGWRPARYEFDNFFEYCEWVEECKLLITNSSCGIVFGDGLQKDRIFVQEVGNTYYKSYGINSVPVLTNEELVYGLDQFEVRRRDAGVIS